MTLIIGIEDGNRSFLVSDSGEWRGRERHVVCRPKIWRYKDILIGCSGNISDLQIVRRAPAPDLLHSGFEFMVDSLIDWATLLQKHLNEYRQSMDVVDTKHEIDSGLPQILIARGGHVFHINLCEVTRSAQGFSVVGQHGFGYGAMHGVLRATSAPVSRLQIAQCAMGAAYCGMDTVFGPIVWLGTDGSGGENLPPLPFENA